MLTRRFSGKSSLLLLLLRFLEPSISSGPVRIDGIPLNQVQPEILRRRAIALPQTPFLLPKGSSVRENLNPFYRRREPTLVRNFPHLSEEDEQYRNVLQAVGLWQLVADLGGLDAALDPNALSKGEKQLLCLARGVLKARDRERNNGSAGGLLLLDEFTASVDLETDKKMQAIIAREFTQYTVVCVTHRLDTVSSYDRVVVMEAGRIVDVGPPSRLIGDTDFNWEDKKSGSASGDLIEI